MWWVRLAKLGTLIAAVTLVVVVSNHFRYIRNDDWLVVAGIAALILINFIALNSTARGGAYLCTLLQRKRLEELQKIKSLESDLGDWQPAYMRKQPGLIRRFVSFCLAPSIPRSQNMEENSHTGPNSTA